MHISSGAKWLRQVNGMVRIEWIEVHNPQEGQYVLYMSLP